MKQRLQTILLGILLFSGLVFVPQARASSGVFDFFLDATKAATAWNFERTNSISLGAGEWANIRINSKWVLSSGCWPGAGEPRCSPPEYLSAANTTVVWEAVGCPVGAACMMYTNHDADNNQRITWGIVPNFYYQPYLSVRLSPQTPTGRYPIIFSVREHPNACQQSGGGCVPAQSQTFYIDVVNTPRPTIGTEPQSLGFSAVSGSVAPAAQNLRLSNTGTAGMNWSATTNQNWCHVNKSSGNLAAGAAVDISVYVSPPANSGTFSCTLAISAPNATNNPLQVPISYSVTPQNPTKPPQAAVLTALSPDKAALSDVRAGMAVNVYGTNFDSIFANNILFITRDSDGRTFTSTVIGPVPGGMRFFMPSSFGVGTYSVQVLNGKDFANLRSNKLVFTVIPDTPRPHIGAEPIYLRFNSALTLPAPEPQYFNLINDGDGPLSWQASTSRDWCHLEKTAGTVQAGQSERLMVRVDTPSNAGEFDCYIEISDPNARNSPYNYYVLYYVSPKPRSSIDLSTRYLGFSAFQGGAVPPSLSLGIGNAGSVGLNWSAVANQDWCHISKSQGLVAPRGREDIVVYVDAPSRVGNFACQVTVSDLEASNNPQILLVNYQVKSVSAGEITSLTALTTSCGTVDLSWTRASGVSSYNIYRSTVNLAPAVPMAYSHPGLAYTDRNVSPSNAYYYWVQAVGSSRKVPAQTNLSGGIRPEACSSAPPAPLGFSVSTQTCGQSNLSWSELPPESFGTYLYRTTQGKQPVSSDLIAQLQKNQQSYIDTPGEGQFSYWLAAYNSAGFSPKISAIGSVRLCSADLSASDKNLIAVNGSAQPVVACDKNVFQGLPKATPLKQGDILTYGINLCNLVANSHEAKNVIVRDNLSNLSMPADGWGLKINGKAATLAGSAGTAGQYAYNSTTKILEINIGAVPSGAVTQITYDTLISESSAVACPKCQNTAKVGFSRGNSQAAEIELTTPALYFNQ